jgi:hypothetical protein
MGILNRIFGSSKKEESSKKQPPVGRVYKGKREHQ